MVRGQARILAYGAAPEWKADLSFLEDSSAVHKLSRKHFGILLMGRLA
jgi:hypothetical protein